AAGSGEGRALDLGQAFYHFSTQPDDTAHYGAVRNELKNGKSVDKTAQANTEQNQTIRLRANFKIGALNHSATLPTPTRNAAQCPSAQAISAKLIISPGSLLCGPAAKPANTSQLGGRIWSAQSLGPVE
ncbi:MAG: hypothetical protein WAV38_03805, partial [Xanthobacteraceae bacterium]